MRRVEEFLGMAVVGGIAGIGTSGFASLRPPNLSGLAYVFALAVLVATFAVTLKAPHPAVIFLSPVGMWIGISIQGGHRQLGGVLALVSFSLMMWTVAELVRHSVRLRIDPDYRERWDRRRLRRG
jgi:hypothetical protein